MYYEITKQVGAQVVTLFGEKLDSKSGSAVRQLAAKLPSNARIVLDLGGVEFVDPAGVGALLELVAVGRARGSAVVVSSPSRTARAILEIVRVPRVVEVCESREAALESLAARTMAYEPVKPRVLRSLVPTAERDLG